MILIPLPLLHGFLDTSSNLPADRQRSSRRWTRRIQNVKGSFSFDEFEVLDQRSVGGHGLGPDPSATWLKVRDLYFGNKLLE